MTTRMTAPATTGANPASANPASANPASPTAATPTPLLVVEDLRCEFTTDTAHVLAIDGVSFSLERGEVLGLVGESGCGKSATALCIMGLLPERIGRVSGGRLLFDGKDLSTLSAEERRQLRGHRIAMIFQDPMTCLNPYLTLEEQLCEVLEVHRAAPRKEARAQATRMLDRVGIADAAKRLRQYPHELSGGMRQRVMIAMALLCDPDLLIADEPTTALDVTIQAQILALLLELRRERGLSILFITHDLAVVANMCDRVLVMYAGRVVETAPTRELFAAPSHPYTQALLRSLPDGSVKSSAPLASIEGLPPQLGPHGFTECAFAPRCAHVEAACRAAEPPLTQVNAAHWRRCVVPVEALQHLVSDEAMSHEGVTRDTVPPPALSHDIVTRETVTRKAVPHE